MFTDKQEAFPNCEYSEKQVKNTKSSDGVDQLQILLHSAFRQTLFSKV